ncbi:unnamed protein product, partial [Ixodes persulcatus]
YSLPHNELLVCIRDCIDKFGAVAYQNTAGISVDSFSQLLDKYLRSTFVTWESSVYLQRQGVCIKSSIAPVLSDLFLASIDRIILEHLEGTKVARVFRYVDDFLVLLETDVLSFHSSMTHILGIFSNCLSPLVLTHEVTEAGCIRFLDLTLTMCPDHVCWAYEPRAGKPLLPFETAHSKISVKLGIIRSLFASSRSKSCSHLSSESVLRQHDRLLQAGYPADLLRTTLQRLIMGPIRPPLKQNSHSRPVCIPYVHNTAHRLKTLAARFDTKVVFTCRMKLKQMCQRVNNESRPPECSIKHSNKYVKCKEKPIYSIPLSCGGQYIGQTGRCLNVRLREHHLDVTKASSDSFHPIVVHARTCHDCAPNFENTTVLETHRDKCGREIIEAFKIKYAANNVSEPSLVLSSKELEFLAPELS